MISKDKPVAVYCRSGKRSQRAAETLSGMGYKVIYDLKGGYLAWEQEK
jgi:rhodanese-related sulfurtransferase